MTMYACDGGDFTGTLYEVEQHIHQQNQEIHEAGYPADRLRNITCWGAMEIGSQVYLDWLRGVHPMTMITAGAATNDNQPS